MERVILASASPQRKTLLEGLGMKFEVVPSSFDEAALIEHNPAKRALVLAQIKGAVVAAKHPDAWIIGCDTLVVAPDGTLLEKPANAAEATDMIAKQSGSTSVVHSGLSLRSPQGQEFTGLSSSSVTFKSLTSDEIEWWIGTKLWVGRSGAFQIDGLGQLMIEKIEGDWTGVVGLPIFLLGELMRKANAPFITR